MKPLLCLIAAVIFPGIFAFAQPSLEETDIEGVWTGFVITDMQVPYEVVISSADGVYSGYSHITFNVNGKKMVAVKKLKIQKENGELIMKDDDHLFDNFQNKGAREFEQTNILVLSREGDILHLNGKFSTKPTRQFKSRAGLIRLEKRADTASTAIASQLKEMTLWSSLSFLQARPEPFYVIKKYSFSSEPRIPLTENASRTFSINRSRYNSPIALNPKLRTEQPVVAAVVKTDTTKKVPPVSTTATAVAVVPKPAAKSQSAAPKPVIVKATPPARTPAQAGSRPVVTAPVTAKVNPPVTRQNTPAPPVSAAYSRSLGQRKIETIQTLYFKTDSLLLTLYDNGEVDGDTVSLIMNGKMILSKQGLSTNPVNKTIYITPDLGDTLQLIMYAENLGTLPPNSGLLIVYDGPDRYEIRFSGDLQKNAAITFRRRKTE